MLPTPDLPPMPSGNWDAMLPGIFYYAKWFIGEYQAFVMVGTALALSFALLKIIVGLFESKDDDDDDEYDYRQI